MESKEQAMEIISSRKEGLALAQPYYRLLVFLILVWFEYKGSSSARVSLMSFISC